MTPFTRRELIAALLFVVMLQTLIGAVLWVMSRPHARADLREVLMEVEAERSDDAWNSR